MVMPDVKAPFSKIPQFEGTTHAKKLSWFLRHGASQTDLFSKIDGSIDVREVFKFAPRNCFDNCPSFL